MSIIRVHVDMLSSLRALAERQPDSEEWAIAQTVRQTITSIEGGETLGSEVYTTMLAGCKTLCVAAGWEAKAAGFACTKVTFFSPIAIVFSRLRFIFITAYCCACQ